MLTVNNMTEQDRRIEKVTAALVTGTAGRGRVAVAYLTPRDELTRETLYYSGWQEAQPMKTIIDFVPYLSGANHVGIRVLGVTPEYIADPVRRAVLARMNA